MDWSLFGFSGRPFRSQAGAGDFVAVPAHEQALTQLRDSYESDDDGAILTGEPGMGKTIILHRFLDWLPEQDSKIVLPHGKYAKPIELHQAILFDVGLPWLGFTESETRIKITEFFLNQLSNERRTLIVIDEAHHLHADVIEELRLLANLSKPGQRAIFILLCGLSSLKDRLETPWLHAAAQRFRVRPMLTSLTALESRDFLWQQLEAAGSRDPEQHLDRETAQLIHELGQGIPRLMNQIASSASVLSLMNEGRSIDCEAVLEAADRMGLHPVQTELSEESDEVVLTIPPVACESKGLQPPKQRLPQKKSA